MIKKIAVRGGHNFEAVWASALIDETIEDRKVKDALISYLNSIDTKSVNTVLFFL